MRYSFLFFIAGYLPFVLSSCNQTKSHDLVILNTNIVDVISGNVLENQTVLIDSGRISSIIPNDKGAYKGTIVDGSGQFLVPGYWDMHVHFRGGDSLIEENEKLLPLYVAHGVTAVRDAGGDLTSSVHQWQADIKKGKKTGPLIFTSGPKLDGPGARWAGSLEVSTSEEVEQALDSLEALNVDFVKIYDSKISRASYLNILEEAQKRGLPASGHMPFTVMLQEAVDRDIHSIEHLYYVLKGCSSEEAMVTEAVRNGQLGFWGSFEKLMATYDSDTAQKRFQSMIQHDTYVVPTLHIGHTLSYLDQNDHKTDEYLQYIGSGLQETYRGRISSAESADAKAIEARHQLHQTFRKLTLALSQAGVQLLAGTDGGAYNSFVYPGISIHNELKIMVECGLTPAEALRTATINGAEFMGQEQDYGSVVKNKMADLVLLNGNPLEDITNTNAINAVIQNGKYLSQQDLAQLMESALTK